MLIYFIKIFSTVIYSDWIFLFCNSEAISTKIHELTICNFTNLSGTKVKVGGLAHKTTMETMERGQLQMKA